MQARWSCSTPRTGLGPRGPIRPLNINVTASLNQLLGDGSMSIVGCDVERRGTILGLKMNITGSFNKLLSDASMAIVGGAVERHRSMSRPSKDMLL